MSRLNVQRHARLFRAAVICVAVAAGLIGVASPAFADASISVDPTNITLDPGQSKSINVHITDIPEDGSGQVNVTLVLPSEVASYVNYSPATLVVSRDNDGRGSGAFQLTAKSALQSGLNASGVGSVQIEGGASQSFSLTVQGPAVPTVPKVAGVVTDIGTAEPISKAKVTIMDGSNAPCDSTLTKTDGTFSITTCKPGQPILGGTQIAISAEKDGFTQSMPLAISWNNPNIRNVQVMLTPDPSTTTPDTETLLPTDTASAGDLTDVAETTNAAEGGGGGGLTTVVIVFGIVLILVGVGAIVMLFVRRKGEDDDPRKRGPGRNGPPPRGPRGGPPPRRGMPGPGGPGGPGGPMGRPPMMPPGPGDPRRPQRPATPGPRGADQTMIARSPLADAPTQLHRAGPGGPPPGQHQGPPPPVPPYTPGAPTAVYPGGAAPPSAPYGQEPYGQEPYGQDSHAGGRHAPAPPEPQYGAPYGQQPDSYHQEPDPREREQQQPRRVDWMDDY